MPLSYQFVDNKQPQREVKLASIDDLCRTHRNLPPDDNNYCQLYETIVNVGILASFHTGESTAESFAEAAQGVIFPEDMDFVRKLLVEDYTFKSWR